MPYREVPQTPLIPLWGVYSRCHVPAFRAPDVPPELLLHFSLGAAPFTQRPVHEEVAKFLEHASPEHQARIRERFGIDELAGTVIRVEPDRIPRIRRLTPLEARELEEAFVASRALEGPILAVRDNTTGEWCEMVHVGGSFADQPYQVRYSAWMPYRLDGVDAPAWEQFLAVLHRLANDG